jgi:uncharacterized protein YndB with AHSA1/START domain
MRRMGHETVRVTAVLPASADRIYAAWLDSREHSRMTGSVAVVDPAIGGEHSAWDGYIEGKNLELEPARRIVQTWRTSDFPLGHGDSRLEVHLLEVAGGTEITLIHSEIPEGQGAKYEDGWQSQYLDPMRKYFSKSGKSAAKHVTPKRAKRFTKKVGQKGAKKVAKKGSKEGTKKARQRAKKGARKTATKKSRRRP